MTPINTEALAALLASHGRADDLNAMVDDKKRPHSEREAIEGLQNVAMKAAAELRRLAAVEAERDALRADAERYRWLRDVATAPDWEHFGYQMPENTDAAIDAAMKGTQ